MNKEKVLESLTRLKQPHLQEGLDQLKEEELCQFYEELEKFAPYFSEQKALLTNPSHHEKKEPFHEGVKEGFEEVGKEWVRSGKVGCLILAGGMGSRLGHEGPKGTYPVTPISQKTLFQVLAEKVKAASDWACKPLPLAVMTSQENHEETVSFFQKHHHFGLSSIRFFSQGELPLLDEEGNWFLEAPGKLAKAPDGNGYALHHFAKAGILQEWQAVGIEHVTVLFVDNPLANPFDFSMIGLAVQKKLESVIKAVDRLDPKESMGVIAKQKGKLCVVEYSELSDPIATGSLSSTGTFCLSIPFIQNLLQHTFPLHLAWKEGARWKKDKVAKCERFLFDLLLFSETAGVYIAKRKESYAPLKERSGTRSLESVQEALLHSHRSLYEKLTGNPPPVERFELASCFEYLSCDEGKELGKYPLFADECLTVEKMKGNRP